MQGLKRPIRFLSIFALALSAVLLGNTGTAVAANPLLCFSGTTDGGPYGGVCTLNAGGTSATLDNSGGDTDGSYSGVYYASSSLSGKPLSAASRKLSFDLHRQRRDGRLSTHQPADRHGPQRQHRFLRVHRRIRVRGRRPRGHPQRRMPGLLHGRPGQR